jgi:hypothetical protein
MITAQRSHVLVVAISLITGPGKQSGNEKCPTQMQGGDMVPRRPHRSVFSLVFLWELNYTINTP